VLKTTPRGRHACLPTWLRSSRTAVMLAMACAACVSGVFVTGASAAEWRLQTTPNPTEASTFMEISCPGECVAVGAPNIRWNGSGWSLLPATANPLREVSCVSSSFCMALPGGSESFHLTALETWVSAGSLAKPPTSISVAPLRVSCASTTFCMAVGSYGVPGGPPRTLAESWNGTAWTFLAPPSGEEGLNYLNGVSCTSSTSCTAIGTNAGKAVALRWNGSVWSSLGTPNAGSNTFGDISCIAANACVAELGHSAKAESWDGTSWTAYTVPTPTGGSAPSLDGVGCYLAKTGKIECFAVGSYTKETKTLSLAELYKGGSWSVVSTPNLAKGGLLNSVSCEPGASSITCAAVGYYREHVGAIETMAALYF
jgi:hypothetical protein